MAHLFDPLTLRSTTFRNRIFVSPMCQYSAEEGMPTDWHFVHLGSRAVGGAGLVMVEATAVSPEGRISLGDSGLWSEAHSDAYRRIAHFIRQQGAVPGIQLAHAGRKASVRVPWEGGAPLQQSEGAWQTLAPSAIPFAPNYPTPKAVTEKESEQVIEQFRNAARLAVRAGFEVVEIHMAHGYLLQEFLSPLSNHRQDRYGGPFENRIRFPTRVAEVVRQTWPERQPVFVRISATDWVDGGWNLEQSVQLSQRLHQVGVDLIDCSSGGILPNIKIPAEAGYQVPFAARIRKEARVATGAVGLITEPHQAADIISTGKADACFLARAELRDPYWPLHAASALSVAVPWPNQYLRAEN
ncbi:MAG TPA: NADH:flavin oxidoreductase/NADH oxidase [Myxococcaceae bacterium]|nr:NADH:flavin oxidoreductase/NADH oxidase [Myxococcaceae bacterium]